MTRSMVELLGDLKRAVFPPVPQHGSLMMRFLKGRLGEQVLGEC